MATIEERLASLEAKVDAMTDLGSVIAELRADMNRQFSSSREDISGVRADMTALRAEMSGFRSEMTELRAATNRQFDQMTRRIDGLDQKVDRHFTWLLGIQIAFFLAIFGAIVGSYWSS